MSFLTHLIVIPATGGDTSYSGREVGTVCEHLEGVNKQPLGTTDSQRVQNTLHLLTQSDHTTCRAGIPLRAGSSGEGGTPVPVGEGSSSPCNRLSQGFLLEYIPGTQEEWPDETRNQPEAVERVGDYRALQDGGNLHPEGPVEVGGLVCEGGSERRLLHSSHRGQSSAIPEIYAIGEELPIHLPSLWPILCPPHLHQSTEASNDPSQVLGSQDNRLHRRYAGSGRISGSSISAPGNPAVGIPGSGLHYQLGEVRSNANPADRILGSGNRLQVNGAQPPGGETEADQRRGPQNPLSTSGVCQDSVSANWETERNCPGSGSSSPVLPPPPRQLEKCPCFWQPWLRQCDNSVSRSSGRAYLVAAASRDMEWQMPPQGPGAGDHSLRCLPIGLGSNMQGHSDRWSVVRAGEDVVHQLPRDAGSCPCNPDLSEGSNWVITVTANGQYHCSGLRQQSRGNSIPTVDHPGENIMDVGTPEGHHVDSPTHTRCVKYSSGHRIQDGQGPYRMEIEPRDLQPDQPNLRPLEVDLFTSRLTHQLPGYFSWRSDRLAEATDAFRQDWRLRTGYANPPWCLMGRVLSQVMEQEALIVLVAPAWKGQPWYPVLLSLLWEFPRLIPSLPDLIQNPSGLELPELMPQLAVWPISGKNSITAAIQKRLQVCCWPPGGPSQASLIIHTSGNGLAGVLNEVPIPFQDV